MVRRNNRYRNFILHVKLPRNTDFYGLDGNKLCHRVKIIMFEVVM